MRTKDEILKELGRNRQPGAYGGIPTDRKNFILTEVLVDIRDILQYFLNRISDTIKDMANKA